MDQYIGKLLDNRYEILEIIGTGGMARVYKARCHRLNRLVAIKILREDLAQDAEFRRRFHDESQAVAMLSHPNIVAVYDVSRSSELEYIVMELIDGITLKQYMQKKGNKLNWREALHFITQIVKALGHAHSRGIIHRDIKPHNVMVLRDGSVKVADFGIARVASGGHSTLTQEALGSVHYISPEQARGSRIDARSDLYSAGVVLYEMITGRLPFEGDTPVSVAIQHINSIPLSPREIDPSIPEALEEITMKAMAPKADNRYSCADEMLADLEEFRKNPNINFDYNLSEFQPEQEPDEDKTRIRPAVSLHSGGESRERGRPSHSGRAQERRREMDRYEEDREEEVRGGSPWVMVASVAAVLLFVVGVLFLLSRTVFSDLFAPPETFQVPRLVGHTLEEVQNSDLLQNHFTLVVGGTEASEEAEGTIIGQDPAADSQVGSSKTEITVTVSAGPKVVYMPDLYNMEYRTAFIMLDKLKLKYKTTTANDDKVAKDHIISFSPVADAPLAPGTEVELVISLGPKVEQITMPSLVEMTLEKALSTITTMNLEKGEVTEVYDDTIPAGSVVSHYPLPAAVVDEGTKVNLQVSKGPEEVEKTVDITLPDTGGVVNVQVLVGGSPILNQDVDTAMQLSVPVTIKGKPGETVMLAVYIDGTLTSSITEVFP